MKIKLIVFDVNGTLFDDTDIFWKAINGIFEHFDRLLLPLNILRKRFGQPWTRIYREEGISEDFATDEELYKIYNELYKNQPQPKPFPDVESTLHWLNKRGIKIAIVSTQQNEITIPLLKKYGLGKLFFKVSGSVSDKAAALKEILKSANILSQSAAYVGDQEDDIRNAKKAKCVSIAFNGGLHSRNRLEALNPDFMIDKASDLKTLLLY